jgi:hypothetical protein
VVMGLRFLGSGASAAAAVAQGEDALRKLEEEEHARQAAVETTSGESESPLAIDPLHHAAPASAVAGGVAAASYPVGGEPEAEEELEPTHEPDAPPSDSDEDDENGPTRKS